MLAFAKGKPFSRTRYIFDATRLTEWRIVVNQRGSLMDDIRVGQVWEQVSKHERGMQLEVVRGTGHRWVLRPVGGGPSKRRGLREGLWTLSTEQIKATCRLVRDVD